MVEHNVGAKTITLVISIMGIFNGAGRLVFSTISDKLKKRMSIYKIILVLSILVSLLTGYLSNTQMICISLIIISACYGAGFSCLPPLLSDIYDMKYISRIHGLSLTAWAIAGLVGNQISSIVKNITGNYIYVYFIIGVLYSIALVASIKLESPVSNRN